MADIARRRAMEQNEEYGLDTFRTVVFGGFRKDDVLEYLDSLTGEIEQVREDKRELESKLKEREAQLRKEKSRADKAEKLLDEADKERDEMEALLDELDAQAEEYDKLKAKLDAQAQEYEKLQTGLDTQTEEYEKMKTELKQLHREKAEKERLKDECEQLRREKHSLEQSLAEAESREGHSETEAHYKALCLELEERINSYEKRKATASEVLINAKLEAEHVLSEAESKANYTIRQAELQKRTAKTVVQRFAAQNIEQMKLIKQQMQEYLDILGGVYQGVEQARSGLSQSIIGIPQELETLQNIIEGDAIVENDVYGMDDML